MNRDAAKMLEGVPEVLRPLLPEVWQALRDELAGARAALIAGDASVARSQAHKLKGAAMRFGLAALSQDASRAEQRVAAGDLPGAGEVLEAFTTLLSELERAGE
jgi:HPt (histidine-containing phosphotransfer) domain-containing protein